MNDDVLTFSVEQLPGMTPGRRDLLGRLGLNTIGDLLFHFPRSYEDLRERRGIEHLTDDLLQTVEGEVVDIKQSTRDGRSIVSVFLSDGGKELLEGIWYSQPLIARRFRYGQRLSFSGKPRRKDGRRQMINPRAQPNDGNTTLGTGIVPIYPLTEDLRPSTLRLLIARALDVYAARIVDILPANLRERYGWPDVSTALRWIHEPRDLDEARNARQRFAYQELLVLQLALSSRRRELRGGRAPVIEVTSAIDERIRRLFPFTLTDDQNRAIADLRADIACVAPMQRLVQADVGAGKTAIAVYALLAAVASRYQAALMAPTEVLARQHALTLEAYLQNSRVRRLLLTGGLTAGEKRRGLEALAAGEIDLVIGTQALVQDSVRFQRLGLVVIDEQHKFGVHQRAQVRRLGCDPHYLVMTATPIPRTVALTVFGDLDVTLVRQLPPGRQPVITRWPRAEEREAVYDGLRIALREGRQGYIVCPTVEENETVRSAESTFKELAAGPFQDFRLGLLHGRMEDGVKADVMERFRAGTIDLLICTTVIEVGVDVPNATWLIIEHADRFGLSQLHQLRGRVSRGTTAGQCCVFAEPATEEGKQRLRVLLQTTDGFALAEEDARLRGAGDVFGPKQHGTGELWLLAQARMDLLECAHKDARELIAADPGMRSHEPLRAAVLGRYGTTLELARIG